LDQRRQVVRIRDGQVMVIGRAHARGIRGEVSLRYAGVVGLSAVIGFSASAGGESSFRRLTPTQITARLGGMEITDGVHWAEQYMRNGTFKAFHMGKANKGKWYVRDGELCLDDGKKEPECKEIWLSGSKVEFRVPGSGLPPFDGVLQKQEPRG
jgi:hypothetical protein